MESSKPRAALLSGPGLGHLIPLLELGKRLVTHHGLDVTIFASAVTTSSEETQLLHSTTSLNLLHIVELPQVDVSNLVDDDATIFTRLVTMMRELIPSFRSAIHAMKVRPTVLIVDIFGFEALHLAEFDMPKYVFFPSPAWILSLLLYLPILDVEVREECMDEIEPLQLPGCKAVRPEDVPDPMLDRTDPQYLEFVRMGVEASNGDGYLVNTWVDLEPTSLNALRDHKALAPFAKAPVYPVGPLTRSVGEAASGRNELLEWLDRQPSESVMYVSFGSGGTLSAQQLTELAWGLERSTYRFIWVVRPPMGNESAAAYFTLGRTGDDPSRYLPEGFLSQTQDIGVVIPYWAPQREILGHPSVGGFLSHCGWNSTLESILNGVPMVAWPLYAEQRMNATMATEELGIAVKPAVLPNQKVVIRREEIEQMVRRVMEDKEMRHRVKELKKSGEIALSEGGSSYNSLSQVAKEAKIRAQPA